MSGTDYARRAARDVEIVRLNGEGKTDRQIGDLLGVSGSTVQVVRSRLGLPTNGHGRRAYLDLNEIRRMVAAGRTDAQVAEQLQVSERTVQRVRKENAIPPGRKHGATALDELVGAHLPDVDKLGLTPTVTLTFDESRDALCAQTDPEIFFPEKGQSTRAAKAICAKCPLTRVEDGGNGRCLEVALANRERFGVFGGLTERERRIVRDGLEIPKPKNAEKKPRAKSWNVGLPREHGTDRGYHQHRSHKDLPCTECLAAHAEVSAENNRKRREATA